MELTEASREQIAEIEHHGLLELDTAAVTEAFGMPHDMIAEPSGDNVTIGWRMAFDDGMLVVVKGEYNPEEPSKVETWHIGGSDPSSVDRVRELVAG